MNFLLSRPIKSASCPFVCHSGLSGIFPNVLRKDSLRASLAGMTNLLVSTEIYGLIPDTLNTGNIYIRPAEKRPQAAVSQCCLFLFIAKTVGYM